MDDEFWCRFYRLMVFVHAEDNEVRDAYIKKALPLIEKSSANGLSRKQQLYLLGEYYRLLGHTDTARRHLNQAAEISIEPTASSMTRRMRVVLPISGILLISIGACLYFKRYRGTLILGSTLLLFLIGQSTFTFRAPEDPDKEYYEYLNTIITEQLALIPQEDSD